MKPLARRSLLAAGAASLLAACAPGSSNGDRAKATTPVSGSPSTSTSVAGPVDGGPARFVTNGNRSSPGVALTFHCNGDPAMASRLLDEAARLSVPLTVFMVGTWLEDNRSVAERMLADGHELANHTFTHPSLGQLERSAVADEIVRCAHALSEVTGSPTRWFRASGMDVPTDLILEEAGRAGYPTSVGYDVDPLDYQDPGASVVVERVNAGVTNGSIVSLHFDHEGTIEALEPMVAYLHDRGLAARRVQDLLDT